MTKPVKDKPQIFKVSRISRFEKFEHKNSRNLKDCFKIFKNFWNLIKKFKKLKKDSRNKNEQPRFPQKFQELQKPKFRVSSIKCEQLTQSKIQQDSRRNPRQELWISKKHFEQNFFFEMDNNTDEQYHE